MTSICIFCGANKGVLPEYRQSALALVDALVSQEITLVYGGGNVGLMGVIADQALMQGGKVIGVMPEAMISREIAHTELTQMHIVADMHERKKRLTELSDAFIALPGGTGTMDELFQEIVLKQTGYHNKVCGLLNTEQYYDHLVAFIEHGANQGFIKSEWQKDLIVEQSPEALIGRVMEVVG